MYRIILKNGDTETTVLDYSQKKYILDGKVERESNKSDLLSFSVDHSFDKSLIKEYRTLATVYDENDVIFRGRTITNQKDLYNTFTVDFEGALSFLNDSQYPPFEFTGTPKELFESVINNHNSQVEDFKKLKIGNCTVTDPNDYLPRSSESYMSSLEILKDRLVKSLGGFLIVRYENDGTYIDYLESITNYSTQKIKINENLIDINITVDSSNVKTVLIPLGARDEETGAYLNITSVNGGKNYIENTDGISKYGRITAHAVFENVTVASNLLTKAQALLNQMAIPTTTITLSAVDLHMIDNDIDKFELNQWIRVESTLHEINTDFLLSKITYDLLNPENNKITLGTVEQGLSDSASSDIAAIESSLASIDNTLVYQNMKITGKLDVNVFNAFKATIEDLEVDQLSAKVAEIEQAYISKAQVEQLYATKAEFNILSTNVAEIEQAYIDDIEAIEAQIAVITAGQITAGYIEANYAKIDLSNIENGCITTAMIGVGVVDTAQIADAAVTDAKIVGMTANKITAGTIDAALIEVVNLNAANITVGTINGVQIANGAIDMNKLSDALSTKITDTEEDVQQALIDVGLAQTDATQALEDALEAFQKAQEALSSASAAQTTANGKNTIFYQTSAPSTSGRKTNDIWYDIDDDYKMYYFNGTSWVGVEFGENAIADGIITSDKIASEVSSKINQAFTNAEQAIEDSSDALSTAEAVNLIVEANKANWDKASTALTTANGKNTIYYQSSQPSTSGKKTNDIWFDTANGYRMYYFNGTSWVAAQFGVNAIADNAVTADKIADSVNSAIAKAQTDATKGITDAASALEAIDNLEIGGRNYIQLKKLNSYRSYNTVPTYSGNVITSTFNTSGSNKQYFFTLSIIGYTPSNDVYTLSGYLKVNDAIPTKNLFVDLASTHGGNLIRNEYDSTTGYFVITQTYPGNSAWIMHCKTTWTGGTADVVTLTKLKFEKGNRATDWTPAPEDTDSAITTAQATADGKNTVFYQTSAPSTSNRKTNDIWFDTDDGNKPYYWNGSSWTAQQFGTSAIKNLAITNALIADGTIQNAKISNLDAAKITTGTLAADRIGARTIAASKLIANTVTADSGVIANAAIKSAMIVDAAIATAKIADLAVTNAKLANLSVTNAKIADATIQSAKIAALDAGKITSGYISADRIAANSITANKLLISAEGYIKNPNFERWSGTYPDGLGSWGSNTGTISKQAVSGKNVLQIVTGTGNAGLNMSSSSNTTGFFSYGLNLNGVGYIAVEVKFRLTSGTNPSGAGLLLDFYYIDSAGAGKYSRLAVKLSDLGTSLTANTWYTLRKVYAVPSIVISNPFNYINGYLMGNYSECGTLTSKTIQFASVNVYGATYQDYLTQSWTSGTSINGGKVATGTITADKLKASTITASSGVIANAAILTAHIADLAVSSGKIANAAIGTAKIADLAVTNAKLANLAVTNAKIADATIQSAKIAALDAGKITSGYISSDRIAAGSLVIGKLDSSTQTLINNSQKLFTSTIDLSGSSYDVNNYYPVVGTAIPGGSTGYHRFIVAVQLNSGTKPSWSTHTNGFTCNLDVEVKSSEWGTTNANGWVNDNSFRFCDKMPATFWQMSNSSLPVFYLRGGGKYFVKTDYSCTWSIKTATYTSNSQSVAPTTSPQTWTGLANHWTINTAIANWCYNNDRTYINGGKIYTGTVAAAQIAASAITAEKIATNAVIAAKIAAGAITSDKLSANSVVAGKIAANAVTTGTIAADAVNADKIAANAILAEHIKAGVITGDKLVAATITGAKIAASTITANNIAAGTITAAKIASGTITATQIASGTITATQLASNSVTAVKIAASAVTADKIAANAVTAAKIATDAIKSRNYVANSTGSYLNLSDGSFSSKNLKWDANGNLTATNGSFTGTINSTAGTIAGFTINSSGLTVSKTITNGTLSMKINTGGAIIISQEVTDNNMSTNISQGGITLTVNNASAYYSHNRIIIRNSEKADVFQIVRYNSDNINISATNYLTIQANKDLNFSTGGNLYHNGRKMMPVYMVSGSVVKSLNSDSVVVHTWVQIKSMFQNAFGFSPSTQTYMGVTYANGDGSACSRHLEGCTQVGTDFYAVLSGTHSGNIRVNYAYFYCMA